MIKKYILKNIFLQSEKIFAGLNEQLKITFWYLIMNKLI